MEQCQKALNDAQANKVYIFPFSDLSFSLKGGFLRS